ncbi:MAG: hypothetical protein AB3N22_08950 [Ruegeria sp.]
MRVTDSKSGLVRCIIRIFVVVIAVSGLTFAGQLVARWIGLPEFDQHTETAINSALLVFLIAAAIPFVPGAEIGLALLKVLGKEAAVEVYFAMLAALLLAFTAGRLLPAGIVANLHAKAKIRWRLLRLKSSRVRLWMTPTIVKRVPRIVANNRHVALGAVLNMPGNSILGGGGGIALLAGASRQYSYLGFGATISIAVLPIPFLFFLFG